MEIAQTINDAINQYYFIKGVPVPNWRMKKDPDWWIQYLKELDNEN